MQGASMPRRYLALWFPWFPCERVRRLEARGQKGGQEGEQASSAPLVLVARTGNALRLTALDESASRLGLTAGMTLADARARCPGLTSLPHESEADLRELERLTARMQRFTPMAAVDPPGGIMLDVTACAHLFGGEAALARAAMAEAGYTARHAFAAHAASARALVRYGHRARYSPSPSGEGGGGGGYRPGAVFAERPHPTPSPDGEGLSARIHALPIAALELPEDVQSGLRRAGLVTLGDLAARPMAALAARFGGDTVARLRAVLGEQDSPMVPQHRVEPLRAAVRFAEPVARTDFVLDVIEDLLAGLCRQMEARHLGGRRFVVRLERTDGARRQLAVETSLPSRDPVRIVRLFRERIEGLADPLDPGFGFDAIVLAVPRSEPLLPAQSGIDGEAGVEVEGVAVLIDRLTTRFGADGVLRPVPRDTHLPEIAQRLLPAMQVAPAAWPQPGEGLPRPLFLLDPPQPVTALAGVPDGPPQRLRWRGKVHEVIRAEGPERIAAEWWRRPQGHVAGGAGLTRDYYRIEDETGARYWVFRHGLYQETGEPRWYMHGLFA